ncbi:MAG: alanine racemase [Dorea sp.]|nr:alanine racemase [Dorea sp.]
MKYTWMEIDLDVIGRNYEKIKRNLSHDTDIIAVVKADAYGLGAVPIAKKLERTGCRHFAVTFLEEAVELRKAGIKAEILVMMPVESSEAVSAADYGLTVTMADYIHAKKISDILVRKKIFLKAHIKLDCGLSRMGIVVNDRFDEAVKEAMKFIALPGFRVKGIYTHITAAGLSDEGRKLDKSELDIFKKFVGVLNKRGICLQRHCLCSEPLMNYQEYQGDFIRIGSLLYGVNPARYEAYGVENCLSMKSKIIQVKEIPKGASVSYGALYAATRKTRIAIVPAGFADGLRRALSNIGEMIVHGRKVPIIGKICCDHTILDVTDIEDVKEGDIVTILGKEGETEQYAGEFAGLCHASEPEITSIFASRVPRIYLNNE